MRTECSRNCWIAGGIAGLLVWMSIGIVGSAGWAPGLFLGLITAWFLGATLVWGVCQGAGNRADNEALLAGGWPDAPFIPSRRVVRAGGALVSEEPLALADRIPGGAPLDSRTVTPMRGGEGGSSGGNTGQGADAAPAGQPAATARASAHEGDAATGRPRIVAGAGPDAPVRSDGTSPDAGAGASRPDPAPDARAAPADEAGARTNDPALLQPAPGVEAQVAHPTVSPVEGMDPEKPKVRASESEAEAFHSTGFVEPRTDSETGSDPRAPEGRIEPLDPDAPAPAPAGEGAASGGNGAAVAAAEGGSSEDERRAMAAAGEDGDAATGADDLTRIRGIGPMLQTWLAGYGVIRVEQVAEWDDADIARFAGMMGRMGHRIRDEDWVGQARLLAAGGETAHSHAVDTGEAE